MAQHNLEVTRIETIEAARDLQEDWNGLLRNSGTKTIELTYEWQMTYWKYFSEGAQLFILAVKDGDTVVGIAPLKLRHTGKSSLPVRRLEFIATQQSNYQDFIIGDNREDVVDAVFDHLCHTSRRWDILKLSHVPEASPVANRFLSRCDKRFLQRDQKQACIFLQLDKPWSEYVSQSKKARKKIAHNLKQLQQAFRCEVTCAECRNETQLCTNLSRFFDLHCAQWNPTDTPSQFNDDRYRQFYIDVSSQLWPKHQVKLFVLEAAGQPIAYTYAFEYERTRLAQLTAYDCTYARYAPGLVIFEFLVQDAFANDAVDMVDFGDYYPYKEHWTESLKNKLNVEVFPKRPWPICIYLLTGLCAQLHTRLGKHPQLLRRIDHLRQRLTA